MDLSRYRKRRWFVSSSAMARSLARLVAQLFSADRPTLDVAGLAMIAVGIGIWVGAGAALVTGGVGLVLLRMAQEPSK